MPELRADVIITVKGSKPQGINRLSVDKLRGEQKHWVLNSRQGIQKLLHGPGRR